MNIKIGSFFRLSVDIIPRKDIQRLRFKLIPLILRELKISNLLILSSGVTYVKDLSQHIPEIVPKIKMDIVKISPDEFLNRNWSNSKDFFPGYCHKEKEAASVQSSKEVFIAAKGNELLHYAVLSCASGGRLMITGSETFAPFRGKHINSAVLTYIMKYLRGVKKIREVYVSTNGANIGMHKSILRAGFKIDIIFYDLSLFNERIKLSRRLRDFCNWVYLFAKSCKSRKKPSKG